jgi:phenylacetaldehyde dehydrogenase
METVNPATGQTLGTIAAGDQADVDAAVAAAQRAFEDRAWSRMNPHERTRVLLRLADAVEAHAAELAELETLDNGMPYTHSFNSMNNQAKIFRYYAGWPTKIFGTTNPSDSDTLSYTIRQPLGVCAGIIPWNTAVSMAVWKIAPALACGNTVIIKPAEDASLAVLRLGEILTEAGLPDGVLNIVTGLGATVGAAISMHPGIAKVAFTGSTVVGKKILVASAGNLKHVTLELGGKSPHIIFDDADIETAARNAKNGFCTLSGQACASGTRLFVQDGIYDQFVDALAMQVKSIKVGDPFAPGTTMGPLASAAQFEKVTSYLALGNETGKARTGGEAFSGPGYFVPPTIFEGMTNDKRVAREEIFGPVVAVIPFSTEDEVIRLANDTSYGLAAGVATQNLARAHRLVLELDAGVVWVNTFSEMDPILPFGGFKESGIGRENGEQFVDNYTQTKSVFMRL